MGAYWRYKMKKIIGVCMMLGLMACSSNDVEKKKYLTTIERLALKPIGEISVLENINFPQLFTVVTEQTEEKQLLDLVDLDSDLGQFQYSHKIEREENSLRSLIFSNQSLDANGTSFQLFMAQDHNFTDSKEGFINYVDVLRSVDQDIQSYQSILSTYVLPENGSIVYENMALTLGSQPYLAKVQLGTNEQRCDLSVKQDPSRLFVHFNVCPIALVVTNKDEKWRYTSNLSQVSLSFGSDFASNLMLSQLIISRPLYNSEGFQVGTISIHLKTGKIQIFDNNQNLI